MWVLGSPRPSVLTLCAAARGTTSDAENSDAAQNDAGTAAPGRHRGADQHPRREDPGDRRRHGHADPGPRARRGRLPRGRRTPSTATTSRATPTSCSVTQPEIIREIHRRYLEAGADIVCTNTFTAHEHLPGRLRPRGRLLRDQPPGGRAGPRRRRRGAHRRATAVRRGLARPDQPDRLDLARRQRPRAPATSASTSSSSPTSRRRAAWSTGEPTCCWSRRSSTRSTPRRRSSPSRRCSRSASRRWPVIISGTITDASGRTLSGQTTEAFWNSVRHVRPLAVGLNCALGAEEMRPYVAELSRLADCFISTHPNAGLPNEFGEYDQTAEQMSRGARPVRRRRPGQPRRRLLRHHPRAHRR